MPGKKNESIPESDYLEKDKIPDDVDLSEMETGGKEVSSDSSFADDVDPPCTVTFHSDKDEEIGRLEFTDGVMKFTGDVKPSAKVFFDWLIEGMVNPYVGRKLKKIIKALEEARAINSSEVDFDRGFGSAVGLAVGRLKKAFKV